MIAPPQRHPPRQGRAHPRDRPTRWFPLQSWRWRRFGRRVPSGRHCGRRQAPSPVRVEDHRRGHRRAQAVPSTAARERERTFRGERRRDVPVDPATRRRSTPVMFRLFFALVSMADSAEPARRSCGTRSYRERGWEAPRRTGRRGAWQRQSPPLGAVAVGWGWGANHSAAEWHRAMGEPFLRAAPTARTRVCRCRALTCCRSFARRRR